MLTELVKLFTLRCPVNMSIMRLIQKANGLNLKMKGASYSSLMSGMVLGFSCHPQTILNYEKTLAEANESEVQKRVKEVIKVRLLTEVLLSFIPFSSNP